MCFLSWFSIEEPLSPLLAMQTAIKLDFVSAPEPCMSSAWRQALDVQDLAERAAAKVQREDLCGHVLVSQKPGLKRWV